MRRICHTPCPEEFKKLPAVCARALIWLLERMLVAAGGEPTSAVAAGELRN